MSGQDSYGIGPIEWDKIRQHYGHAIEIAFYGDPNQPANIAIECTDCAEVLTDSDLVEASQ